MIEYHVPITKHNYKEILTVLETLLNLKKAGRDLMCMCNILCVCMCVDIYVYIVF